MDEGSRWIDGIVESSPYEWERLGSSYARTMLRPDLPCRITASEVDSQLVLYVAVGTNGTPRYWQWATLDQRSRRPIPQVEALARLRRFLDLVMMVSESEVQGELAS